MGRQGELSLSLGQCSLTAIYSIEVHDSLIDELPGSLAEAFGMAAVHSFMAQHGTHEPELKDCLPAVHRPPRREYMAVPARSVPQCSIPDNTLEQLPEMF
jgi:hypothetical protein